MKTIFFSFLFAIAVSVNAQIAPILDHTWTIEKIIKEDGQVLMADLNPFGEYDTFKPIFTGIFDDRAFYYLFFGHCEANLSFDDVNSQLFYHASGCFLDNDDSSEIALYFNEEFIFDNTPEVTIDNEFLPFAFGPLSYSFNTEEEIIYLDITNPIGEVARFYAANLSQQEFLKQQIKIYPNPAISIINIESPNILIEQLTVYDLNGQMLLQNNKMEKNEIDVSVLQQGVYIIEIKSSAGIVKKKLVKR